MNWYSFFEPSANVATVLPGRFLFAVRDGTALDQRQNAVADHLGVDAQVVFVAELHDHRVGNAAVANLQCGTVVDHVGHILANGLLHRPDFWQANLHHRVIAFHQGTYL